MAGDIDIRTTADGVSLAAADTLAALARDCVRQRGVCCIAISGGSTPLGLYRLLGGPGGEKLPVPWPEIRVFWCDERHVPPGHVDSNYRMAREAFLSKVPLPASHVHRIRAELPDAATAAAEYEEILRRFVGPDEAGIPRLDLVLLGMGVDGHTASLFPGSIVLNETRRLVAAVWVEKLGARRITLTPPLLNSARAAVFLVTGRAKAATVKAVVEGPPDPARLPAQIIQPRDGRLLWIIDRDAAMYLHP